MHFTYVTKSYMQTPNSVEQARRITQEAHHHPLPGQSDLKIVVVVQLRINNYSGHSAIAAATCS